MSPEEAEPVEAEREDGEAGGACAEGCCDEEDPFVEPETETGEELDSTTVPVQQPEQEDGDGDPKATETDPKAAKKQTSKAAQRSTSLSASSRLEELSKPKPAAEIPPPSSPTPVVKKEKKAQANRPSLLLRLRPTNLEEAWAAFEESGFQQPPRFTYAHSDEIVTKYFEENSHVCFELLPEAKRILQRVQDDYGGPEAFTQKLYGDRKIPATELRDIVAAYLKDHNIEDKVEIRIVDNMLSAANVLKPGADEKYIVNIANGPISWNMVQGICDHEVGTHLLRMMNDEHQVWHGIRDRYKLANPWTTEEGFATLNTYQSMPCTLMYPQALRYYAVCRGAQSGFVELFHELMGHTTNPKSCWQMCCRIKRGMIDTSLPGAFYLDQAYFKGAVEILRHLNEVDFGRLYGGQIALQDLDKVHFLLRKEVVRLPRFLNSAETLKTYKAHCRRLIKENQIEASTEMVCKPMFIRTAREFFKPSKPKALLNATVAIGQTCFNGTDTRSASVGASRPLDAERLAEMAQPRQLVVLDNSAAAKAHAQFRELDRARVTVLSQPRRRTESETPPVEKVCTSMSRSLNLARLEDLAKPRNLQTEAEGDGAQQQREVVVRRNLDQLRLFELALPRKSIESAPGSESGIEPPQPVQSAHKVRHRSRPRRRAHSLSGSGKQQTPDNLGTEASNNSDDAVPSLSETTPRLVDEGRLAELATPRKKCDEDKSVPCKYPPKGRRKRRSKHRILAMVQDLQQDHACDDEDAAVQQGSDDDDDDDALQQEGVLQEGHGLEKIISEGLLPKAENSSDSLDNHVSGLDQEEEARVSDPHDMHSIRPAEQITNAPEFSATRVAEQCLESGWMPAAFKKEEPCAEQRAELRPEPRIPRSRAVARARSLGSSANAVETRDRQAGSFGAPAGGLAARSTLPFNELELAGYPTNGCGRGVRVPVGLPRGVAAAVAAASQCGASGKSGGSGGDGPLWKAVPIKVMQFDFGGL